MTALRSSFWANLIRKKTLTPDVMRTDLKKCLTLGDLTFLAIGSMVGSGLYVLTGTVAQSLAGPSIVISYLLAAIASGLSAVCYAEFGARVPVTGSAYQFTYLTVGEFWAFVIGWNVILEHVVGASVVAKGWSGYLDAVLGKPVQTYMLEHCPMPGGILAKFPDFIAVGFLLIATVILATGAQMSSKITAAFAGLNMCIVVIIIGTGFFLGDVKNWTTVRGGFFPYGFSGTLSGAATLIFSYVGYEIIASTTEESLNPSRDVPLSLLIAMIVVVVAYTGASAALTLMVPWFKIDILSPFPDAYAAHGWAWARYLVTVGAMAAMTTSMVASMFVVPRYLFAMARDGLLMQFFAKVDTRTQVPLISVLVCSAACIIMAILFDLHILVEFISIGQLLACTFVALCVIKLRYQPNSITRYMEFHDSDREFVQKLEAEETVAVAVSEETRLLRNRVTMKTTTGNYDDKNIVESVSTGDRDNAESASGSYDDELIAESAFTAPSDSTKSNEPDEDQFMQQDHIIGTIKTEVLESKYGHWFLPLTQFEPGLVPFCLLLTATLSATIAIVFCLFTSQYISTWWSILSITLFSLVSVTSILLLYLFNQDTTIKTFKVPLVPIIPYLSIVINIALMLKLQPMTWVRLGIWMFIGLIVYFCYGYRHSIMRKEEDSDE